MRNLILAAIVATSLAGLFGTEADVCFHAWAIARYVEQVAAAGKAVYPFAAGCQRRIARPARAGAPGNYESGGPPDNVIAIWKAEAPALAILAPDIYMSASARYFKVLAP